MFDNSKNYYPNVVRVVVPASTPTSAPYELDVPEPYETLEYIEFFTEAGIAPATGGVKIFERDVLIYPAPGGNSDAAFTDLSPYGLLPLTAQPLKVPFARKLRKGNSLLHFQFVKDVAGALTVVALIVCSSAKQKSTEELRVDHPAKE